MIARAKRLLAALDLLEAIMTTLSKSERNALSDDKFGLPDKRAYPMPDASHARNAKARAAEEFDKGNLSSAEKAWIDSKASTSRR
jgi:hypothetical protein